MKKVYSTVDLMQDSRGWVGAYLPSTWISEYIAGAVDSSDEDSCAVDPCAGDEDSGDEDTGDEDTGDADSGDADSGDVDACDEDTSDVDACNVDACDAILNEVVLRISKLLDSVSFPHLSISPSLLEYIWCNELWIVVFLIQKEKWQWITLK